MPARDLNDLYFFVQVVQHNGFAAAGRALDIPKSTLSRRIQELETRLGRDEIRAGALRRVLPEWIAGEGMITMLVPSRRGQLPSVRAFMDFLIAELPSAMGS